MHTLKLKNSQFCSHKLYTGIALFFWGWKHAKKTELKRRGDLCGRLDPCEIQIQVQSKVCPLDRLCACSSPPGPWPLLLWPQVQGWAVPPHPPSYTHTHLYLFSRAVINIHGLIFVKSFQWNFGRIWLVWPTLADWEVSFLWAIIHYVVHGSENLPPGKQGHNLSLMFVCTRFCGI